jgi:biopolymer transport protein ExbD
MAMSTGGNAGGPMSEINVTPLVDVMLVLLIIFMITAPLMSHSITIQLPTANPKTKDDEVKTPPLDLAVKQDGSMYLNDHPVTDAELKAQFLVDAQKVPAGAADPSGQDHRVQDRQEDPWQCQGIGHGARRLHDH